MEDADASMLVAVDKRFASFPALRVRFPCTGGNSHARAGPALSVVEPTLLALLVDFAYARWCECRPGSPLGEGAPGERQQLGRVRREWPLASRSVTGRTSYARAVSSPAGSTGRPWSGPGGAA